MLRTKKQIKNICEECPVAKTANLIGDTFTLLIIRDVLIKSRRFCELEASLLGVSSRTITKKLKFLKEKGIIERHSYKEKPPRVEYSITEKGQLLSKIIETMRIYGKNI